MQEEKLRELIDKKKVLVVAHRGVSKSSIIENTVQAARLSKLIEADIVEADVIRTTDGKYYMFHDGIERQILGIDKNIKSLSSSEVEELRYYNAINSKIDKKVETLDYYLKNIPRDIYVNIDRSWDYWEDLLPYFDRYENSRRQILLKSHVVDEVLELLDKHPVKYMYFPIVKSEEDIKKVEKYKNINLIGFEIVDRSNNHDLIKSKVLDKYRKDYMLLINTMNLDDQTSLFGDITDEMALLQNMDENWGKAISYGVNAIQTDWPQILIKYLDENYR